MVDPLLLRPLNGGLVLACAAVLAGVGTVSLRRHRRGEGLPVLPLAVAFLLPLALVAWASTWQQQSGMAWAATHPEPPVRQTWMAIVISRTIATQVYGGGLVALSALALLVGAVAASVEGERPRWLAGGVGGALAIALVAVGSTGLSDAPALLVASRMAMYAAAGGVAVAALVAAHRRGPGTRLATLTAVLVPAAVVGADLASLGAVSARHLEAVAQAPPLQKQALMYAALTTLDGLQHTAWLSLGFATALAMVGPVAVWRRERPHAGATVLAVATLVVVAGVGLSWSTGWAEAFR